ncbi:hypothetical protein HX403_001370 [Campylobacter coli]|nr:hypothetical protein [Campylobacter coli]EGP7860574.1 hypothetical protein [Campylobacter jejuni]
MDKIIVANRFDGLGERLLAFLNAIYLSNLYSLKFKFIWNSMDETNPELNTEGVIFPSVSRKEFFFSEEFISNYYYNDDQKIFDTYLWSCCQKNSFDVIVNFFQKNNVLQCNLNTDMSSFFSDIPKIEYKKNIATIWRSIDFSEEIKAVLGHGNKIIKSLNQNYAAIHIRGGDIFHRTDILYLCRFKALEVCLSIEILRKNKDENIVLLGNDKKLNLILKNTFIDQGYNVFTPDDLIKDNNFNVDQKAIFDIVLMANSKKLYLSGNSGFSNLAYLIGNCERICVYDLYSAEEKYNIIKNNLRIFDFNKYQKSFAFVHLYIYGKELKLPLSEQICNMQEAISIRDEAFVFKVFYIDLLLQNSQYDIAENFISLIIGKIDIFFENLLYNGWGRAQDFLYDFVFLNYLNIKDIERYPNLYCITYYLIYRLLIVDYKRLKNEIEIFLRCNYFNKELLLKCPFLHNSDKIVLLLENEIVKSINNYTIQAKSAKDYIYNHLAYKLGLAYSIYSKGIFSKLMLPIILIYIVKEHKRNKIIQKKISSENPTMSLPCLKNYSDYKESLLEKNSFNYKLGEIIINGHKNWYKGGYIKMFFDIYRLKSKQNLRK